MTRLKLVVITAFALATLAAMPAAATAQEPRASIAGAYVYFQQLTTGGLAEPAYTYGWAATGAFRLGHTPLSAVGEFGVSYRTNDLNELQTLTGIMGGARFTFFRTRRLAVFGQTLVGLERFAEPGLTESGLAVQPGAGIDVYLSSNVFVRAQGDYRWSQPNDSTFHAYRVLGGIGISIK